MDDKIQINEKDEKKEKEDKKDKDNQVIERQQEIVEENNNIETEEEEKIEENNLEEKTEESENNKENEIIEKQVDEKDNKMVEVQNEPRVIIIPIGKIIFILLAVILVMTIFSTIPKLIPDKKDYNKDKEKISYEYNEKGAFLFEISENGKGEYAKGKIVRGTIKVGDQIELIGLDEDNMLSTVNEIYVDNSNEKHKNVESAKIGENAEIHFKTNIEQIKIGKVLAQKDTIKAIKKIEANIAPTDYLEKSEKEKEVENGKIYNFYIRQTNIKGKVELDRDNIKISKDNKNFKITIDLEKSIAVDKNTKFYLVEGGKKLIECTATK